MRSLTKPEKEIVKRIIIEYNTLHYISFEKLVHKPILDELGYDLETGTKTVAIYSRKRGTKYTLDEALKQYNFMFTTALLLELLERNGLIVLDSTDFYEGGRYIGKKFPEDKRKDIFGLKCNDSVKELFKKVAKGITPTPALEVYVKNGCRTDEQLNKLIEKGIGFLTLFIAVIGLLITSVFSWKTYNYTIEKDKADSIAEAKKDSLDNFYRNELMLNLDRVAESLNMKETLPVIQFKPEVAKKTK